MPQNLNLSLQLDLKPFIESLKKSEKFSADTVSAIEAIFSSGGTEIKGIKNLSAETEAAKIKLQELSKKMLEYTAVTDQSATTLGTWLSAQEFSTSVINETISQLEKEKSEVAAGSAAFKYKQAQIDNLNNAYRNLIARSGTASQQIGRTTNSVTSLNYIIRDSPFLFQRVDMGIMAISNNLNPFIDDMLRAKAVTGSWKAALGQLGGSLVGFGGISVAFSIVVAAIQAFSFISAKAKGDIDDIKKKAVDTARELRDMAQALRDFNSTSLRESKRQLEQYTKKADEDIEATKKKITEAEEKLREIIAKGPQSDPNLSATQQYDKWEYEKLLQDNEIDRLKKELSLQRGIKGADISEFKQFQEKLKDLTDEFSLTVMTADQVQEKIKNISNNKRTALKNSLQDIINPMDDHESELYKRIKNNIDLLDKALSDDKNNPYKDKDHKKSLKERIDDEVNAFKAEVEIGQKSYAQYKEFLDKKISSLKGSTNEEKIIIGSLNKELISLQQDELKSFDLKHQLMQVDIYKYEQFLKDKISVIGKPKTADELALLDKYRDKLTEVKNIIAKMESYSGPKTPQEAIDNASKKLIKPDRGDLIDATINYSEFIKESEINLIKDKYRQEIKEAEESAIKELDIYKSLNFRKLITDKQLNDAAYLIEKLKQQKIQNIIKSKLDETENITKFSFNVMTDGARSFWSEFIVGSRQAANKWDAVWLSIRNSALNRLADIATNALWNQLKNLLSGDKSGFNIFSLLGTILGFIPGGGAIATIAQAAIPGHADGGLFRGKSGRDKNLSWLSDFEYVVNPDSTKKFFPLLEAINNNKIPGYANGGLNNIYSMPNMLPGRNFYPSYSNPVTVNFNGKIKLEGKEEYHARKLKRMIDQEVDFNRVFK